MIEVAAVALEAFGKTEGLPVGGIVEGASVFFGVVKAFGKEGSEAMASFELTTECAQGEGETLAGEVGAACAVDDKETAKLDDELGSVGPGDRVSADVVVAFLEVLGGSAPAEDANEFRVARLGVSAVDSLPEDMPGGASGLEIVAAVKGLTEDVNLGFFRGGTKDEILSGEGGLVEKCFHNTLNLPKWQVLFSGL